MHDKTYQYMISNRATAALKSELQDILKRDKENCAQIIPTEQLQVASAELALRALNGDYGINNVDPLLDSVGALYARNKSLTKGHATLTRRVQELEAQLAEAQQQAPSSGFGSFAVVSDGTHIKESVIKGSVISKAQHDLIQDITSLSRRVEALEVAQKPSSHSIYMGSAQNIEAINSLSKTIDKHIKQALENATKPGGILNGR